MKTTFATFLFWLSLCPCFAQNSTLFEIEKLSKPKDYMYQVSARQMLGYMKAEVEKTSTLPDSLVYLGDNPVLTGFLTAYKEHRPIVLSPDIVWLLISQGFARHLANNAEELRGDLVSFKNKKTLKVAVSDIKLGNSTSNWEQVFPQFTAQISDYTGKELVEALTCNFSTTTPVTRIASQITVMESVKAYFEYVVIMVGCGLPNVTLEGSTEDWERVLSKTQYLTKYKLGWWTSELEPILQEIIKTKKGKGSKRFWMNMVKAHTEKRYGSPTTIDGWIVKFYPYTSKGKKTNFKPVKDIDDLAAEMVKVPFLFVDVPNKTETQMEFWAGFVGMTQNKATYALRPEIAWAVVNKQQFKSSNTEFENSSEMDDLSISNVTTVPEDIYALRKIDNLHLNFLHDIVVPDAVSQIAIGTMWLTGKITPAEEQKLRAKFPNTKVFINDLPK